MRVVAGEFRGRVIDSPSEKTTRPTTDRVRESMFSSIYSRVDDMEELHVLDAFAGSGALGIEALSRGARTCVFFERDSAARRVLEANIASVGLKRPRAIVSSRDVLEAALRPVVGGPFSLVLLDPPYALEPKEVLSLLSNLAQNDDLENGAVIVYEHSLDNKAHVAEVFDADERFTLTGQKKYGKIGVSYFEFSN